MHKTKPHLPRSCRFFQVFRLKNASSSIFAVKKPPSRDNHRGAFYPRTRQRSLGES